MVRGANVSVSATPLSCAGRSRTTRTKRTKQNGGERKVYPCEQQAKDSDEAVGRREAVAHDARKALSIGVYLAASTAAVALQCSVPGGRAHAASAPTSSSSTPGKPEDFPKFLASGGEWTQNRYKEVINFYTTRVEQLRTGSQQPQQPAKKATKKSKPAASPASAQKSKPASSSASAQKSKPASSSASAQKSKPAASPASAQKSKPAASTSSAEMKAARRPAARPVTEPRSATEEFFQVGNLVKYTEKATGQAHKARITQVQKKKTGNVYRLETEDGSRCFKNVKEGEVSLLLSAKAVDLALKAKTALGSAAQKVIAFVLWAFNSATHFTSLALGGVKGSLGSLWQKTSTALAQIDFSVSDSLTKLAGALQSLFKEISAKAAGAMTAITGLVGGLSLAKGSAESSGEGISFSSLAEVGTKSQEFLGWLQSKAGEGLKLVSELFTKVMAGLTGVFGEFPSKVTQAFAAIAAGVAAKWTEVSSHLCKCYHEAAGRIGNFPESPFFLPGVGLALVLLGFAWLIRRGKGNDGTSLGYTEPSVVFDGSARAQNTKEQEEEFTAKAVAPSRPPPRAVPTKQVVEGKEAGETESEKQAKEVNPIAVLGAAVSLGAEAVSAAMQANEGSDVDPDGQSENVLKSFGKDLTRLSKDFDKAMAKGGASVAQAATSFVPSIAEEQERKEREAEEARAKEEEERKAREVKAKEIAANVEDVENWISNFRSRTLAYEGAIKNLDPADVDDFKDYVWRTGSKDYKAFKPRPRDAAAVAGEQGVSEEEKVEVAKPEPELKMETPVMPGVASAVAAKAKAPAFGEDCYWERFDPVRGLRTWLRKGK
ncbi:hypothetical protein A3770_07p46780 [Chloropicon primus]|uniref:Uncharacterized protein n=1 Tax=Chloropicon primus TaxID=1764295 RepID=A0A5B8MRX0_9CHLO|nr:hypothetical protein A3770_07p46780 [Chloropicon primus]|eukprot:QDZ22160.1 hypothetical protein A3770_07p46780 [Chloropicon primus]